MSTGRHQLEEIVGAVKGPGITATRPNHWLGASASRMARCISGSGRGPEWSGADDGPGGSGGGFEGCLVAEAFDGRAVPWRTGSVGLSVVGGEVDICARSGSAYEMPQHGGDGCSQRQSCSVDAVRQSGGTRPGNCFLFMRAAALAVSTCGRGHPYGSSWSVVACGLLVTGAHLPTSTAAGLGRGRCHHPLPG